MNLAIEYFIRSGIIYDYLNNNLNATSLFLRGINEMDRRLVVTIHRKEDSDRYLVKHWDVLNCTEKDFLPPVESYDVGVDEISTSEHVIVPGYSLLPFKDSPYPSGIKQRSKGRLAIEQERNYYEVIENFFFPCNHIRFRTGWLLSTFFMHYGKKAPLGKILNNLYSYIYIMSTDVTLRQMFNKWQFWQLHMNICKDVAPELLFYNHYKMANSKLNEETMV